MLRTWTGDIATIVSFHTEKIAELFVLTYNAFPPGLGKLLKMHPE